MKKPNFIKWFLLITYGLSFLGQAFAQPTSISSIIGSELIFSNCAQTKQILTDLANPVSPSEKEVLARYLERILSLESQSLKYLKTAPNSFGPSTQAGNLDMAHFFDPEREKKAKLCVLEISPKLLPQSSIIITKLLEGALDRRNAPEFRNKSIELYLDLLQLLQNPAFPDYLLKDIVIRTKGSDRLLHAKLSLPLLTTLIAKTDFPFVEVLNTPDPILRDNLLQALVIDHFAESQDLSILLEMLRKVDEGTKAQFITKLRFLIPHHPHVVEHLPTFSNSTSKMVRLEFSKLMDFLAKNSALYASYFDTHAIRDDPYLLFLEAGRHAEKSLARDFIRVLLPLDLPPSSMICKDSSDERTAFVNLEEFSFESAAYLLKRINCPDESQHAKAFQESIKNNTLSNILPELVVLLSKDKISRSTVETLAKSAKQIKKKYSGKEYNHYLYLLFHAALRAPSKNVEKLLVNLALDNLGEDIETTALVKLFFQTHEENPLVEFLANYFSNSGSGSLDQRLALLLKARSPLIKKRVLSILSNDKLKLTPLKSQVTSSLLTLLNDDQLEIRRAAYLILKNQKLNLIEKFAKLANAKGPQKFYISRLVIDKKEVEEKTPHLADLQSFISSLETLGCPERTTLFSDNILMSLKFASMDSQIALLNSQKKCLSGSSAERYRAVKNIVSLPRLLEFNEDQLMELADIIFLGTDLKSANAFLAILDFLPSSDDSNALIKNFLSKILTASDDKIIISGLAWLIRSNVSLDPFVQRLKELSRESEVKIAITSLLLLNSVSIKDFPLSLVREKFYANMEMAEELIQLEISEGLANRIKTSNYIGDQSYFGMFLTTLVCQTETNQDFCGQISYTPSLIIDRPSFMVEVLQILLSPELSKQEAVIIDAKKIIASLIQLGFIDEVGSLKKTPEMINILTELRLQTNNTAYSKILDFLLEQ